MNFYYNLIMTKKKETRDWARISKVKQLMNNF